MIKKYRKKPIVIEAIQWTGNNKLDIVNFTNGRLIYNGEENQVAIQTLEGIMRANINDYIIKGVNGEFYPCKPDIFEKTYEVIEDD